MRTFEEYMSSYKLDFDPETLDLVSKDIGYFIYQGSKPLQTPGGNNFSPASERIAQMIITDLQLSDGPSLHWNSAAVLYSFLKDILCVEDPFLRKWETLISSDPFVIIKTKGGTNKLHYNPEEPLFTFAYNTLSSLTGIVNNFASKVISEVILEDNDSHPFPEILKLSYERLSPERKTAVQALSSAHNAGLVMPLLVVTEEISIAEYVKGLIALKFQAKENFSVKLAEVAGVMASLEYPSEKGWHEKLSAKLISEGEGDSIEFKSTLRWDIRAGKNNPAIERASLKTLAAFLNSKGGNLLIGVRDDGSIEGIETDKFANDDKFLLHLWTLIRNCMGREFSPYFRTRLEKIEEKTICIVDCLPSNRPVFLKQAGYDEEMFIRVGPSSNALDISEALKYIKDHFPH